MCIYSGHSPSQKLTDLTTAPSTFGGGARNLVEQCRIARCRTRDGTRTVLTTSRIRNAVTVRAKS